jgi:hypothetical protein
VLLAAVAGTSACAEFEGDEYQGELGEGSTAVGLDTRIERGEEVVAHPSPHGVSERCVIPQHYAGGDYSRGDREKEQELCSIDFYADETETEFTPVAVCPKLNSTNPGLDLHALGNLTKVAYESSAACRSSTRRPTKKEAKYKQTVTCSDTRAILSYYHVSRLLGDVLHVPVAVLRTMDKREHRRVAELGRGRLPGWTDVLAAIDGNRPYFVTADGTQSYGALIKNPGNLWENSSGDEQHPVLATRASYDRRYEEFLGMTMVWRVNARDNGQATKLGSLVRRDFDSAATDIAIMTDISDLMLLDYLLMQQDRFGNIAAREYYYYRTQGGELEAVKARDVQDPATYFAGLGDIERVDGQPVYTRRPVPRVVLKDSDCGLRGRTDFNGGGRNRRGVAAIDMIAHMNPATYQRLQWMAAEWDRGLRDFLVREAALDVASAFSWNADAAGAVGSNLRTAARRLRDNCRAGALRLDLDVIAHTEMNDSPEHLRSLCDTIYDPTSDSAVALR